MNKAQRKQARASLSKAIERRFPYGSTKGDPLGGVVSLGSHYRQVNSLTFGSKSTKPQGYNAFSKV
jgi:hypothetical protein